MELRKYQKKLISDIRQAVRQGNKRIVAILSCGGGKSVIQAEIARSATEKGNRVLFLVHRKELCEQIKNTFAVHGVDMTLCTVGMVQTISRHIDTIQPPVLIITDEAHHSIAKTYTQIYSRFNAVCLGFTATPCRLGSGGLGAVYDKLILSVSAKWLIDNHFLAPYRYYSAPLADTSGLHTRHGEYIHREIADLMQNQEIYGQTVRQWERLAKNKKTIVYCSSVLSAEETAKEFTASGYPAESLDGSSDKRNRAEIMRKFRDGDIKILCNCELFGEGLDVPDCECVVLLRPTKSLSLFIQQSMRPMRYMPDKQAVIIDHVGNVFLHGLPDDERKWTLEYTEKKTAGEVKVRECEKCFAVYSASLKKCPICGYEPPEPEKNDEKEKEVIDVDLAEITAEKLRNVRLCDAELKNFEEVKAFRQAHGYRFNWCIYYSAAHNIAIPPKYNKLRRILEI